MIAPAPTAAPRVLVTGFGSFRDVTDNPSGGAARLLDGRVVAGLPVVGRELRVTYAEVARAIPALVAELRPVMVISTGVGRGDAVAIERVARNRVGSAEADVDGVAPFGLSLSDGAPDERRCAWDADALAMALDTPAQRVVTSPDAGGYVCNAAFWHLTSCLPAGALGGFVHLPPARDGRTADGYAAVLERLIAHLAPQVLPR